MGPFNNINCDIYIYIYIKAQIRIFPRFERDHNFDLSQPRSEFLSGLDEFRTGPDSDLELDI